MVDKHTKRYLISSVIRKTQIKTTVKCHFVLTRMSVRQTIPHVGENMEEQEQPLDADGDIKWNSHFGNSLAVHQHVSHKIIQSRNSTSR